MLERTAAGSRATSYPATVARPPDGLQQRAQDADGRRLPGAVRPEEAEELARLDRERDVVDRDEGPESLDEALYLDRGRGAHGVERHPNDAVASA